MWFGQLLGSCTWGELFALAKYEEGEVLDKLDSETHSVAWPQPKLCGVTCEASRRLPCAVARF